MSYPNQRTLDGCISSLSTSVSLMSNSLDSLDPLAADFHRLKHILKQKRIFTLVPEFDLNSAKQNIVYEVEPKILRLLEVIKVKLSKLERKNSSLVSKIELNNVRINNFRNDYNGSKSHHQSTNTGSVELTEEELEKLRQLRLKKDRLKYKLSSINLQRRKDRLSMVTR